MKLLGLEIKRAPQLAAVPGYDRGWRRILEPFSGAWQKNIEERRGDLLTYPTLYACLSRISKDIGKLPFLLKQKQGNGTWKVVEIPAYSPVLRKPNHYQNPQQFREAWVLSTLIHGNAYVLKERDNRGVVIKLYVLDPCRVMPMVSPTGDVFYKVNYLEAANLLPENYPDEELIIPAREIIHDRMNCFHHQLIGVPPVCAAHWPALKNLKILKTSAEFFANSAQPGGILTAPAGMTEKDAEDIQRYWSTSYTNENAGKVAVIGADMKFTSFAMKGADSQLVEQMRYSDEQICQPFGIPPFKIGIGSIPAGMDVDDINLLYHGDALSPAIESMENLLDDALNLDLDLGIWLDIAPLIRMDLGKQAEVHTSLTKGGIETPDEARLEFNLPPLPGGDTVYMQKQDIPLEEARKNKSQTEAAATPVPANDEPLSDDEADAVMEDAAA